MNNIPHIVDTGASIPKQKPLTDEEIRHIHEKTEGNLNFIKFARAIEERHGIK